MILKDTYSLEKSYDKPRQRIKKHRHYLANKVPCGQSYGFSSSHVCMWELENKNGWVPKNWCLWKVVLGKTLGSPLDSKEIKPVNPERNQPWILIGRADTKAEAPILWPPKCEELTHWKRPWCWEGLGAGGEGDNRGWDGWMASPTQWTWLWVNSGCWWWQGGLVWCGSWIRKELDTTEWLNWTELKG